MSMNQKGKKSPLKRIAMVCSAVFVGILFLMAGSCPGGGPTGGTVEGPHIAITQGIDPIYPIFGSYNFGDDLVWGSYDVTFTIHSIGDETLNLTGSPELVSISPEIQFTVLTQPPLDAIDPGNTTDFIIQLDWGADSTYMANVTVESNDPDVPSYTFEVTGTMSGSGS